MTRLLTNDTLEDVDKLALEIASNVGFYSEHGMSQRECDDLMDKGTRFRILMQDMTNNLLKNP